MDSSWAMLMASLGGAVLFSGPYTPLRPVMRRRTLWQRTTRREQNDAAVEREFMVLLRRMVALLQGGRSMAELWRDLHPRAMAEDEQQRYRYFAMVLARAARTAELGLSVADSIRECADAMRLRSREQSLYRELSEVLEIAEASGAPIAELLTSMVDHRESEQELSRMRRSALAGPRATTTLLSWLPLGGLFIAFLAGFDPFVLFHSGVLGIALLVGGIMLNILSRVWAARLFEEANRL